MSTDISIKAKETFINIPDVDGESLNDSRSLTVTKDFWYAQIFLAKTNQLPKIFFMAKLPDLGDSNEDNNLKIQLYSVDYNETTQQFSIDSPVGDPFTYPFDTLKSGSLSDGAIDLDDEASWYQVTQETAIDLTNSEIGATGANTYYAFVFSSQVEDTNTAPRIYYSLTYRQPVFPLLLAAEVTDNVPDSWSNNLVPTVSTGANTKAGAIIFGYVGNELGSGASEFEAGTVTLGGGISSRRGYPTFIHVENSSTQASNANSLAIGFSQLSNESISDGLSEETDTSMMKWYFYDPASLPRTSEAVIFGAEDIQPVLDQSANFVVYYQPDRLPPYPKVFCKESDINLVHGNIDINVIYQSTDYVSELSGTPDRSNRPILVDEQVVTNVNNDFDINNFAHFQIGRVDKRIQDGSDSGGTSVNPDYMDFTLEDTEEELKELIEIRLTDSDSTKIRGFTNVIRFKDRYIAFGKYETQSDGWFYNSAPTGRDGNLMRAYVSKTDDIEDWNSANISFEYAQSPTIQNDILDWYEYNEETGELIGDNPPARYSRIIGVHDAVVQRAWSAEDEEYKSTLFVVLQVFPSHLDPDTNLASVAPTKPFFAVAWLQEQPTGDDDDNIVFKIIPMENTDQNDARFDPVTDIWGNPVERSWIGPTVYPRVNSDYKGAFFIVPDSSGSLYVTARNPSAAYFNFGQTRSTGKFGLWGISLETDLESKESAPLIKTSGTPSSGNAFDFRGFNREALNEIEISYVLKDGNRTYFGTSNYDYDPNDFDFNETDSNPTSSVAYSEYGYAVADSYGFSSGYPKFGSSLMGEVYSTSDFRNFNQIISGSMDITRPGQEWLNSGLDADGIDYISSVSMLDSSYSYAFPHVVNDRVAYMAKINSILHVWLSPSVHNLAATPFHVAHDLSTSARPQRRTRLLRKFPITDFTSDSNYDTSHDGGTNDLSNLANNSRSKYIRKIDGGIKNGHSIFIVGTEGEGKEFRRFDISSIGEHSSEHWRMVTTGVTEPLGDGVTVGLSTSKTKYLEDFTSVPHFAWITGVSDTRYNSGPFRVVYVSTDEIIVEVPTASITGGASSTGGTVVITKDHYKPGTAGLRWLIYDDRVINQLYAEAGTVDSQVTFGYAYSEEYTSAESAVDAPWGHYTGVSKTTHPYLLNPVEYQYYPHLNVTQSNKRESPDVGIVHEVDSYVFDGSTFMPDIFEDTKAVQYLGLYETGSIVDDIYNINPRLVNQNGTTYLVCDNGFYSEFDGERVGKGYRVYKTYGLKQIAEKWGKQEGLDLEIFNESLQGQFDFAGIADTVNVSQSDRVTFVSSVKLDKVVVNVNPQLEIGRNYINEEESERYIYAINNGMNLPQSISFFYKLYNIKSTSDAANYLSPDTSNSKLVLKWANTREDLYSTSNSLEIGLAQDVTIGNGVVQDLSDIVFYKNSFPTDLEAGFFRLESVQTDVTPTSEATVPNVEIIVKGLRMHSVDLGGAEKIPFDGSEANVKTVIINGIVESGNKFQSSGSFSTVPEQILDNSGGCFISPGGYIIVDFPKPMYVDEISFSTLYSGSIGGQESLVDIEVATLPVFDSQKYGVGTAGNDDWEQIDDSPFSLDEHDDQVNKVVFDSIRRYTKAIRIKISDESGVPLNIFGLKIKSLAEGSSDIFVSDGVSNPNLIVIDDLVGLLRSDLAGRSKAYSTFNRSDSYLIYDLGLPTDDLGGFPVNRITMNIHNADSTRKIAVDVWDGVEGTDEDPTWENVYDGKVVNYQHYFVNWTPQLKDNSRKVNIENITTGLSDIDVSELLKDTAVFDFESLTFASGRLQNYSFRPNIRRDETITIVGSQSSTEAGLEEEFDGLIVVNTQMDEDGPFGLDVTAGLGLIERNLNIVFPLRQIRKIRIRMTNSGRQKVIINGLKTYTPLIQPENVYEDPENPIDSEITRFKGDPIWPREQVTWRVRLTATATGV